MKNRLNNILQVSAIGSALIFGACSLDESNPGGTTIQSLATTEQGYLTLLNQCYFGMERTFYGTDGFMQLTEADTDLWTYKSNQSNSNTQYFWFFANAAPNTTYTNTIWYAMYDGIGSCNVAIQYASDVSGISEAVRNNYIARARFMRALMLWSSSVAWQSLRKCSLALITNLNGWNLSKCMRM